MGIEIERKFLVQDDSWRAGAGPGRLYRQGYITPGPPAAIRVRLDDTEARLHVKQATTAIVRTEFEYVIPREDAVDILETLCADRVIEKTRYRIPFAGHTWEVDLFHGNNDGLVVAEIELDDPDQPFDKPPWLGKEVSGDPRFLNTYLALHPYRIWQGSLESLQDG
jgi:adenylate cyclase